MPRDIQIYIPVKPCNWEEAADRARRRDAKWLKICRDIEKKLGKLLTDAQESQPNTTTGLQTQADGGNHQRETYEGLPF